MRVQWTKTAEAHLDAIYAKTQKPMHCKLWIELQGDLNRLVTFLYQEEKCQNMSLIK
ncbi:hypothetical protein [Marinomonas sp. UCMA 3892]|uniref:hypothetical protein n=1 Tax=unclassified Marinomonas TaxID=196814 RepID=UPI002006E9FD|nr:hypothetical protein [Marinomonas sp. UCMA 3892]